MVADVASVLSLDHIAKEERDVFRASSASVGDLLACIMGRHPGVPVWLGVGGTATCDAGIPAVTRLLELSRERGFPVSRITLLCDVDVPLLAPEGMPSAMSFVAQKGCPPGRRGEIATRLEESLRRLEPSGVQHPGDGAGGGIPFAFRRMLGAETVDGAGFVLERSGLFADPLPDLVITGEGSLDVQSVMGKLPGRIACECRRLGISVTALCGRVDGGFMNDTPGGPFFTRIISTEDFALPGEVLDSMSAWRRLRCGAGTLPVDVW